MRHPPASSVPVDFAVGFLHAVAVTVVGVVHARGSFDLAFSVPGIGIGAVGEDVAGSIVGESGGRELVARAHRHVRCEIYREGEDIARVKPRKR